MSLSHTVSVSGLQRPSHHPLQGVETPTASPAIGSLPLLPSPLSRQEKTTDRFSGYAIRYTLSPGSQAQSFTISDKAVSQARRAPISSVPIPGERETPGHPKASRLRKRADDAKAAALLSLAYVFARMCPLPRSGSGISRGGHAGPHSSTARSSQLRKPKASSRRRVQHRSRVSG